MYLPADFISNMGIFMSMLLLLREAPFNVRSTLCQLLNSIFHHTPEDVLRVALIPGWEVMFFNLLSPPSLPEAQGQKTPSNSSKSRFNDTPFNAHYTDDPTTPTSRHGSSPPPYQPTHSEVSPCSSPRKQPTVSENVASPSSIPYSNDQNRTLYSNGTTHDDPVLMNHTSCSSPTSPTMRVSESNSLLLSTTSSEKQFRPRSYVFVERKDVENNCTMMADKEQSAKKLQRISLSVSTPWMESMDDNLDEEVLRTVDIVTQMLKHILWYSTLDQTPWKVMILYNFFVFKQGCG